RASITEATFKCLTKIDDNRAIRNLMTLQEITEMLGDNYSTEQVAQTIDKFREQGNTLIRPFKTEQETITKDTVLDITHEALIRNWQRLSDWSWEEHASVQMYREFRSQLDKWKNNNYQKSYLMSVGSLSYYNEEWFKQQKADPKTWLKRYMWDSEKEAQEQENKEEKAEQHFKEIKDYLKKSKQNVNRKKILAQIATITIILLLIIVSIAYYNSEIIKIEILRTAKANMIATRAYMELEKDPTLAFRLAEAAYAIEPTPLAKQVIMAGYGEMPFYQKLEGHTATIKNAIYSPDGSFIVTGSNDYTFRIWSNIGELKVILKGHKGMLRNGDGTIDISSDNKYIDTATADSTARIWDLEGNCLAILKHDGPVNSVYFSSQPVSVISNEVRNLLPKTIKGKYLVLTASSDKTAILWDIEGNEITRMFHEKEVSNSIFSRNGMKINTISDNTIRFWDMKGTLLKEIKNRKKSIQCISYSDEYFIMGGAWDSTAILYDHLGNEKLRIKGATDWIYNLEIIESEKIIVLGNQNGLIELFSMNGKRLKLIDSHKSPIWDINIAPNNNYFVSASDDGTVRLWNLDGQELMLFKGHTSQVMSANFSPDGKYVVTGSGDGTARIWNIKLKESPVLVGHTAHVMDVNVSWKKNLLITAGADYTAKLWNWQGEVISTLIGHKHYRLFSAMVSPNNQFILTGSSDGTSIIWNVSGVLLYVLDPNAGRIMNTHISNDSRYITMFSEGNLVSIWDTTSKQIVRIEKTTSMSSYLEHDFIFTTNKDTTAKCWILTDSILRSDSVILLKTPKNIYKMHKAELTSVDYLYDTQLVLTTSEDSTAIIWSLDGENLQVLSNHKSAVSIGKFSPNGNYILTVGKDNIGVIWKKDNNQYNYMSALRGHSDAIMAANFSYNSNYVVTSSNDNSAIVWDLYGRIVASISNHSSAVYNCKFSPDDNYILTASLDHTARLTPWRVEDILQKINVDKVRGEVWELGEKDKEVFGIN
ncbi:MAG: WD40 repeat domain-containing protein, partial [Bacteroidia bacterium]|nr:WD40 repeat domain-containing protein [Bacteroidia bacterium]